MLPGDVGIDRNFSQNPKRNGSSLNETALHCESETSRWIHYDASISPVKRSTINQRIGKKGKREGRSPSNGLLGRGIGERGRFSLPSPFEPVTLWLGLKSFNKH